MKEIGGQMKCFRQGLVLATGIIVFVLAGCNERINLARAATPAQPETSNSVDDYCSAEDEDCKFAERFARSSHGKILTPEIVDSIYFTQEPCYAEIDATKPPQVAELASYHARKNGPSEAFRNHLNPRCLLDAYGSTSIEHWANEGDPIAEYVEAYVLLKGQGCSAFSRVDTKLKHSLTIKSDIVGDLNLRIPESGFILWRVSSYCLDVKSAVEYRKYYEVARHGGFIASLPRL